ncbi:type II toxin-antitoxin system prevent-host-death family antitoxin [Peptococcaceae bacterium 1198_IL3148]
MFVKSTEFKNNVGKFLQISQDEEVIILKNGKPISKLVSIKKEEAPLTKELVGVLKHMGDIDEDELKAERIKANDSTD